MSRAKKIDMLHTPGQLVLSEEDSFHFLDLLGLSRTTTDRDAILEAITSALMTFRRTSAIDRAGSIKATLAPLLDHAKKLQAGIMALPHHRRSDLHPNYSNGIADLELSRIVDALNDTIGRHEARLAAGRPKSPLLATTQQLEGIFEHYATDKCKWREFLDAALKCAGIPHSDPFIHPKRILPRKGTDESTFTGG